jgi:tetratricopeptide (TPR) repeat protein
VQLQHALYRRNATAPANCIRGLGHIALERSDYQNALPLYDQVGHIHGRATCIRGLGNIALARSDHDTAHACYEQALPLFAQVGSVHGQATCIQGLGDIALARSDHDTAWARFKEALDLYDQIPEPYSIGQTHRRLARLAVTQVARSSHVQAARAAWAGIDRPELIRELDDEFGGDPTPQDGQR